MLSKWRKKLVTLQSFLTVQVKQKIQQSLISQLQQTLAKSKLVLFHVLTVLQKYNQLLRIEDQLGEVAEYKGLQAFYNLKINNLSC